MLLRLVIYLGLFVDAAMRRQIILGSLCLIIPFARSAGMWLAVIVAAGFFAQGFWIEGLLSLGYLAFCLVGNWLTSRSPNFKQSVELYQRGSNYIQVTLYTILKADYSAEMDVESAGVLAAQVGNFLLGAAVVEDVIANSAEPLKSQIYKIKNRIPEHAHATMATSRSVREAVVATLRMRTIITFGVVGEAYLQSDEKQRIERVLATYGAEFPEEIDPRSYVTMAKRFRDSVFKT